ncbi:DNA polymerase [uncultured Selenomonas sp.]|uniref:DNA polymerase n=1 Tax=uncultured Selenomonas sp. TaxID=159275 RepID=UPI0025E3A567|nr:DNA polymerase [uncultured Selenomonas sp.]
MKKLSIDIETYSDVDLAKAGVYRYASSAAFEILLVGVSVDDGPVRVYDLAQGEALPEALVAALVSDDVEKWAYNASFERVCLSAWLRRHPFLSPASWRCSRVWGAMLGLPLSLAGIGAALRLDAQKLSEGRALVRFFCVPCKATKVNGMRTRNLPQDAPEKWAAFQAYNARDVEAEQAIQQRLAAFPVPAKLWQEYALDQVINDRGIEVDRTLAARAIALDAAARQELLGRMQALTGLQNPNSVAQLKSWLAAQGAPMASLAKKDVERALADAKEPVKAVLSLRLALAKSSVKKYQAMEASVSPDGRARGMFQFYGAPRTGRWSGRIIQLQNLRRNSLEDLAGARALVRAGDAAAVRARFGAIPEVLSQLVRTAFVPRPGCTFVVADFSSIEARVLAELAGEAWRKQVFADGGDIYCAAAERMFGVKVEKHGAHAELRQKGKIAELALGYGGSVGALKAMGALDLGLSEAELPALVDAWRAANPHIVAYWQAVDGAVKRAVGEHVDSRVGALVFGWRRGWLFIQLPSGRRLAYAAPALGVNAFGGTSVTYLGVGRTRKWERIESYGAKFVENIVQGISRDILAEAMQRLENAGISIVAHIHDEIIAEAEKGTDARAVCDLMAETPKWMPGLALRAEGYACPWYQKE